MQPVAGERRSAPPRGRRGKAALRKMAQSRISTWRAEPIAQSWWRPSEGVQPRKRSAHSIGMHPRDLPAALPKARDLRVRRHTPLRGPRIAVAPQESPAPCSLDAVASHADHTVQRSASAAARSAGRCRLLLGPPGRLRHGGYREIHLGEALAVLGIMRPLPHRALSEIASRPRRTCRAHDCGSNANTMRTPCRGCAA